MSLLFLLLLQLLPLPPLPLLLPQDKSEFSFVEINYGINCNMGAIFLKQSSAESNAVKDSGIVKRS